MRKQIKVLIDVQGGLVQEVFCTDPTIEVTLLDWDNIKESPELDYIKQDNYGATFITEIQLEDRIAEANEVIKKNVEWEVEQRR
jgi:hypothetical protein